MQYKHYSEVPASVWRWKNFTAKEIACKGYDSIVINEHALDILQKAREDAGVPFVINSGYRSILHNNAIGGVAGSRHLNGSAFDVSTNGQSANHILEALMAAGFTGIGLYDTFIHADTGKTRTWNHRSNKILLG